MVALPVKNQQTRPRRGSAAQPVQSGMKIRGERGSDQEAEELTVPFDGAHLLECCGMTQYDTLLSLERFLQQLQWSTVAPVTRYSRESFLFCCTCCHSACLSTAAQSPEA